MTPWHRLLFVAACSALILAATVAGQVFGVWAAVGAGAGGVLLAVVLAQEWGTVDSPGAGDPAANGRRRGARPAARR